MDLQTGFTEHELEKIIEEAMLYMCACPGQVATEIRRLRELIRYQRNCERSETSSTLVHRTIAEAGVQSHVLMENCLQQVLEIEGWDRATLKMPAGLRKLRDDILADDFELPPRSRS